jgi:hypothetical protein
MYNDVKEGYKKATEFIDETTQKIEDAKKIIKSVQDIISNS